MWAHVVRSKRNSEVMSYFYFIYQFCVTFVNNFVLTIGKLKWKSVLCSFTGVLVFVGGNCKGVIKLNPL